MTYLGFYLLMFLGYINQLFFTPKVAMEKNRDVSILMAFGWLVL
jgi:serine palmitoyltransferase